MTNNETMIALAIATSKLLEEMHLERQFLMMYPGTMEYPKGANFPQALDHIYALEDAMLDSSKRLLDAFKCFRKTVFQLLPETNLEWRQLYDVMEAIGNINPKSLSSARANLSKESQGLPAVPSAESPSGGAIDIFSIKGGISWE